MDTELIDTKLKQIAKTKVNADVVALYMLSKKYKLNLLSLLALYEIYGKDIFLFFYVMSSGPNSCIVGKSPEELEFKDKLPEMPKESTLKLLFVKAKKVADSLRRNSPIGLNQATYPWFELMKSCCTKAHKLTPCYINFYALPQEQEVKTSSKKATKKAKEPKKTEKNSKSKEVSKV